MELHAVWLNPEDVAIGDILHLGGRKYRVDDQDGEVLQLTRIKWYTPVLDRLRPQRGDL